MKAKKKQLSIFDKLFLWLNYGFCLALFISYLAPVVDPRTFWLFAFFGLAYPFILLGNFIFILYWILRQRLYCLLSVFTMLCGYTVFSNNIQFGTEKEAAKPPGDNIRLMTYNVHNFKKFGYNKDVSTKHEILQIIAQEQPDLLGIQEFYTRKKGQYAMADSIRKIMGSDICYIEPFESNNDEVIGMAIFSKYPIINKGLIRLNDDLSNGNQCLFVDIKKNNRPLRIYSVHLQSIQFGPRDYKYLDTATKHGLMDLHSNMRLAGKLKRAFAKRAEQVFKIKAHAAQCPYPYIISGDFNDTPSSFAVNQMDKGLKNAFREQGYGLGRTYNGDFPNYQIDYIMPANQFNVLSYHIIEKKLSDHYPVVSDLMLR